MSPDSVTDLLRSRVLDAHRRAAADLGWPAHETPAFAVERPSNPAYGDYATNLALQLPKLVRKGPKDIAGALADRIDKGDLLASVEVANAFVNFRLAPAWVARQADAIARAGAAYGRGEELAGRRIQVEFISANPTGPLTLANARGGPLGDALASVLAFRGAAVQREYYFEDTGTQFDTFGRSLAIRYRQLLGDEMELPADAYPGEYVVEIAKEVVARDGARFRDLSLEEQTKALLPYGVDWVLRDVRRVCDKFGIRYDHWFRQSEMMASGAFEEAFGELRQRGRVFESEGAVWFDAPELPDDRQGWVLVRSNGEPTYFGKDIAYHRLTLRKRGLDAKIDVWGANTHYHVIRMREAMKALDFAEDQWQVVLYQFVRFLHEGAILAMSRRRGQVISLEDVLDAVGKDATRFFLLQRSADAPLDFDFELALQQSNENPVYYVQYAHARIASIFKTARERGLDWTDADASLLVEKPDQDLVLACLRFPDVVNEIARHYGVHLLTVYAIELAGLLHNYYRFQRVVTDDVPRSTARLRLMEAVQLVLRQTLGLLGITAPEKM